MTLRYAIETPAAPGGVSVIRLETDDPDGFFGRASIHPVGVGSCSVRAVFGVDQALIARPAECVVLIMPHGGAMIVRSIAGSLDTLGAERVTGGEGGRGAWPEAEDPIEASMLATLARAASPLAVDLLLDQPRRWRSWKPGDPIADGSVLRRLVEPAVVVAVGGANIGKSSLLNALAGASVALAFDRAGTTRDSVGVLLHLGGLVVRWVDTPGLTDAHDRGWGVVQEAMTGADLVLRCADAVGDGPVMPGGDGPCPFLTVATRADRGRPRFATDAVTSTVTGKGLEGLVAGVREVLVPRAVLDDPAPWRFCDSVGA